MLARFRNSNDSSGFVPFSLLEWESPWRAFGSLRHDLDRLFGAYERTLSSPYSGEREAEVRDSGSELGIKVDLPGVAKKNIDLSISGENVFLKATRSATAPEGYTAHRRERGSYTFEHSFKLPAPVEAPKAEAVLQDGVLTLTLPKSPNAQPRQIPVSSQ